MGLSGFQPGIVEAVSVEFELFGSDRAILLKKVCEHGETGHVSISKRGIFEDSQVDGWHGG
jgi:hypothetical protein